MRYVYIVQIGWEYEGSQVMATCSSKAQAEKVEECIRSAKNSMGRPLHFFEMLWTEKWDIAGGLDGQQITPPC